MTTRKTSARTKSGKTATKRKTPAKRRTRPTADRTQPDRSGDAVKQAAAERKRQASSRAEPRDEEHLHDHPDVKIDDAVADAVKSSYEVLAQTIAQGRAAAEKFRKGQYNMRQVPGDFEHAAVRVLDLARQLSATTFDICEQLVHQMGSVGGPPPPGKVAQEVPPYRKREEAPKEDEPESGPRGASPSAAPAGTMPLAVLLDGADRGSAHTSWLTRPERPTAYQDISASPLAPRTGKAKPLGNVSFAVNAAAGGLIATVKVPKRQPKGTYSGLVFAKGQDVPLGMLVIELGG